MGFGKTIKLFLIDGEPNGRMTCELSNWTGKAYKIPRIKIKECSDRPDLLNTGIYLLFGKDESGLDKVYIGEAETVLKRLGQHLTQKEFWNEAIVFVSKDENLNKAHVKYLENRLHTIATKVNRYQIDNNTIPTQSSISESDTSEMEEFISNVKILVNTLGHKVFEDKRETPVGKKSKGAFHIKAPRGANASGEPTSDGFVVFEGSEIANSTVPSITKSIDDQRNRIVNSSSVVNKDGRLFLKEDYVFSSPSAAACLVLGRNANGLTEWKQKDGTSLKEFESKSD
jgi:hypothetical protein